MSFTWCYMINSHSCQQSSGFGAIRVGFEGVLETVHDGTPKLILSFSLILFIKVREYASVVASNTDYLS